MNYQSSSLGSSTASMQEGSAQPSTETQHVVGCLRDIWKMIGSIERTACANADRLVGAEPSKADGKAGPVPVPNGTLAEMREAVDGILLSLGTLTFQVERFNSI